MKPKTDIMILKNPIDKHLETTCPQFSTLFAKLNEKIDEDGRSKQTQQKVKDSKEKLDNARARYLETSVRVQLLKDLVIDHEQNPANSRSSKENSLVARLRDNLTLAQVSCMLTLGDVKQKQVTTLGIDPQTVQTKSNSNFGHELLPMLEDFTFLRCLRILSILEPEIETDRPRVTQHPRVLRLADKVADLVTSQELNTQEIAQCKEVKRKDLLKQTEVLENIANNMSILVENFACGTFAERNSDILKNYSVEVESLLAKLQKMILDVKTSTYTATNVQALRKIRNKLNTQTQCLESEINNTRNMLEQFFKCGPELDEIVSSYVKIQKEIDCKKWAIKELQK